MNLSSSESETVEEESFINMGEARPRRYKLKMSEATGGRMMEAEEHESRGKSDRIEQESSRNTIFDLTFNGSEDLLESLNLRSQNIVDKEKEDVMKKLENGKGLSKGNSQ